MVRGFNSSLDLIFKGTDGQRVHYLDDSCENEHTFFKMQNPKTTPYPPLMDAHITGHEIIKKVGVCDEY